MDRCVMAASSMDQSPWFSRPFFNKMENKKTTKIGVKAIIEKEGNDAIGGI